MKLKEITWKEVHHGSHIGFVNKIKLFYICYDSISPRSSDSEMNRIKLTSALPGIDKLWRFRHYQDARAAAFLIFKEYINNLYVKEEENANSDKTLRKNNGS